AVALRDGVRAHRLDAETCSGCRSVRLQRTVTKSAAACAGDEGGADKERYASLARETLSGRRAEWEQRGDVGGADVVAPCRPLVYPPKTLARGRQSVTSGDHRFGPSSQVSANL